ncbi:MAG: hypothetical protein VW874_00345 [Gammaproteobacteria bacterium]|jgi:hypothetical protein
MNRWSYVIVCCALLCIPATQSFAEEQKEDKAESEKSEAKKDDKKSNKIYAIKDRYGNIIGYTDDAQKGSEEIAIKKSTDYTPPEAVTVWTKVTPKVVEESQPYQNFAIASPVNDATVRDNQGNIQIALDIRPSLQPGHKVQILIDGQVISESRGVITTASNVDRGTHNITAKIVGAKNKVIKTTAPVTVHLHRASAGR